MDMRTETGGRIVNNDSEVVAASPLAVRYETLVRVSRAVGAHGDLKSFLVCWSTNCIECSAV